jgi:Tol biopolymer transport system component
VASPPELAVISHIGRNLAPSYSPDGNYLSYVSRRGVLPPLISWGQEHLIIRDIRTGEEDVIIPPLSGVVSGWFGGLQWSSDGKKLLLVGRNKFHQNGRFILDLQQNEVETITTERPGWIFNPIWAPDNYNFIVSERGSVDSGVFALDRDSGKLTQLSDSNEIFDLALHPDGKILAAVTPGSIKLLPVKGGELQDFIDSGDSVRNSPVWSADGKWLYFIKRFREKKISEIWRVSKDGTDAKYLGISYPQISFLAVHPDGNKLAFTVGDAGGIGSIWRIKNFLED